MDIFVSVSVFVFVDVVRVEVPTYNIAAVCVLCCAVYCIRDLLSAICCRRLVVYDPSIAFT